MPNQPTKPLPRSLAATAACLKELQPPTGAFDPNGSWEHHYAVWILYPKNSPYAQPPVKSGGFRLRRKPVVDGVSLDVSLATKMGGGRAFYHTAAKITCAADELATPREWELRAEALLADAPVENTALRVSGKVAGGKIHLVASKERTLPAPKRFTSNWTLFDALQRLPGNDVELAQFAMFEEMDLLKPNQRLAYRQSLEVETAGGKVRLHGFEQIGEGILPYCYWLDDQRRLLLAVGGLRAFVFDPTASVPEDKA